MLLSLDQRTRIADAVAVAERGTSGEIVCVLAARSDDYRIVPWMWATLAALAAPAILLLAGLIPRLSNLLVGGWTLGDPVLDGERLLGAVTALQVLLFVVVGLIVTPRTVRRALTPSWMKTERVNRRAGEQFAARGMARTRSRTGILIYASLEERRARVIADEGIASKAPKDAWDKVIAALVAGMKHNEPGEGFAAAVTLAGGFLAEHFPPEPDDTDELPNGLIEIET